MKKINEILLVVSSLLMIFSIMSDYNGNELEGIRQDSINYISFAMNFYSLSKEQQNDTNYNCEWSDISFPELQKEELMKYQEQTDRLRPLVTNWRLASKIFLFLSFLLNLYIIYSESRKK